MENLKKYMHEWYLEHKEKLKKSRHENYLKNKVKRRESEKKYYYNRKKLYPWINTYYAARQRCTDPNCQFYKRYGGRGIKCLITKEELKRLWFRDKAWLLKIPSIDRKDNNDNYTFENCRYIEMGANTAKANRERNNT